MKTQVVAIDFGTSKIVTLVADNSGNLRCDIVGAGIAAYDGSGFRRLSRGHTPRR